MRLPLIILSGRTSTRTPTSPTAREPTFPVETARCPTCLRACVDRQLSGRSGPISQCTRGDQAPAEPRYGRLQALALVPIAIGMLALVGWSAGIETLTSSAPLTAMNPMTALGLIVAGITTILRSRGRQHLAGLCRGRS